MNRSQIRKSLLWITETAVMLALLVALQAATASLNNQFITGACVNLVLAVTAITVGRSSGLTVALISPITAFILGIAPQILTVPAIMVGNAVYVLILSLLCSGREVKLGDVLGWLAASVSKFLVLYLLVVVIFCGTMAETLIAGGTLKEPMIAALTAKFSWPQLVTALIGGAAALGICPLLNKALKR